MPNKDELRKVKITQYDDGSGGYTINGYFHEFGTKAYLQDNGGSFPFTYAIIELEDGIVEAVRPSRLKFVDSF